MTISICAKCGKRPGTLDWVGEGGALAYVHGMSVRWCELCATTEQLKYARARATEIPLLEKRVRDLGGEVKRGDA